MKPSTTPSKLPATAMIAVDTVTSLPKRRERRILSIDGNSAHLVAVEIEIPASGAHYHCGDSSLHTRMDIIGMSALSRRSDRVGACACTDMLSRFVSCRAVRGQV